MHNAKMLRPQLIKRALYSLSTLTWLLFALPATAQSQSCEIAHVTTGQAPLQIKFSEFFKHPIGPAGLELTDTLRQASGKSVCLLGYMVKQEVSPVGSFFLTPLALETHEHSDGEADDLPASAVVVDLDPSQKMLTVPHASGLLAIQGILNVGRREDAQGRISWVQIQLDASRINTLEYAPAQATPNVHTH